MLLTCIAWLLQQIIIVKTPEIQTDAARGRITLVPAAIVTVLMLAALVAAVVIPGVGLWVLLTLVLGNPLERVASRRRERAAPPAVR